MKISAIIAEYNPFHNGHAYHISQTRKNAQDKIIVIMSGNFVQRGEPALVRQRRGDQGGCRYDQYHRQGRCLHVEHIL